MLPSLDELALASGLSLRQLARDVDALTGSVGLGGGWRALTRRMRLKLAVLCLSAEGATIAQVAKAAGYSSHDAMGRAFRDAGLPSPSEVRAALVLDVA
ncbi:MAG: helix-turn-helix transcriptional regulator [Myxococcales bacterium]|nr:helix-turn-helix transcriptional regulator [Myxococcales bacterium]